MEKHFVKGSGSRRRAPTCPADSLLENRVFFSDASYKNPLPFSSSSKPPSRSRPLHGRVQFLRVPEESGHLHEQRPWRCCPWDLGLTEPCRQDTVRTHVRLPLAASSALSLGGGDGSRAFILNRTVRSSKAETPSRSPASPDGLRVTGQHSRAPRERGWKGGGREGWEEGWSPFIETS